jgi:bifunctional non-homologous end joining protein LigD
MEKKGSNTWQSNKQVKVSKKEEPVTKAAKPVKAAARKTKKAAAPVKKKVPAAINDLIKKGKKAAAPTSLTPMLATLADNSFDDKDWIFEIKWDGYRALSFVKKGKADMMSRKKLSFNEKFYPIAQALERLDMQAVLDGEVVCINDKGKSDFQLLQQWQKTEKGELVYYVFDLLWIDGYNITDLPLHERKQILKARLPQSDIIRYSDHVPGKGEDFFTVAMHEGLEGIMAKNAESNYTPGLRTKQWLKIKTHQRQEAVIAGFTEPRNSRKYFGALVLGVYEKDELIYVGHTGTGFNEKSQADLYKKLKSLVTTTCPFPKKPKTNMPVTWVKPKLVCEIEFAEWTADNIMRVPVFQGIREDKVPKDVMREKSIIAEPDTIEAQQPAMTTKTKKAPATKTAKPEKTTITSKTSRAKKSAAITNKDKLVNDTDKEQVVIINKKELTFTNTDKIYWPTEKIKKRDLLNYYHSVAPYILPYLKDRPQSLNRHPNGINKPGFYQKDVTGKVAPWIKTFDYVSESDGELKKFMVCTDEAALLYMANLACIEMNPWHSRVNKPDNPDWCVIDLDPGKVPFEKVIETALVVKQVTDSAGMDTYIKTSGSTGMHIYIPLGAKYTYEQSRQLAELIVTFVHREIPSFTSLERSPAKRKNKLYLDYLQNRQIQTIASPYSLRPKPGATASAPLHWEEVKKGLTIQDFSIHNMIDRINEVGDIFTPVLGKGIDLKKALSHF